MTKDLLTYLISGGGAAVVVAWWMDTPVGRRFREKVSEVLSPVLGPREFSRYLALFLSVAVSLAAYCLAAWAGYVEWPRGAIGWSDLILRLAGLAFSGSQVIHGATVLRRSDRAAAAGD